MDEMPDDLCSFEVYAYLEEGKEAYPKVKNWLEYRGDGIEGMRFMDCGISHRLNSCKVDT